MKRGQVGIGLVILGVVAIIAVIGLVLLFTRASKEAQGAMLTDLSIGQVGERLGIAPVTPTPKYTRYRGGGGEPMYPEVAYPTYGGYPEGKITYGQRTPAFIVGKVTAEGRRGFAAIEDAYGCENDLMNSGIGVPHDLYNFYSVPNKGDNPELTGYFPPASSAEPRPTGGYEGKVGGDVYAYMNSVGAEQTMQGATSEDLNRDLILTKLVRGNVGVSKYKWTSAMINGIEVPVCWVSEKTFPFPQ